MKSIVILLLSVVSCNSICSQVPVFIKYPNIMDTNDYMRAGYIYFDSTHHILRDYSLGSRDYNLIQKYDLSGNDKGCIDLYDSTYKWKIFNHFKQISPNRIILLGVAKKNIWGNAPRGLMGIYNRNFNSNLDTAYQIHYNTYFYKLIEDFAPNRYVFLCSFCLNSTCDSSGMAVIRIDSNGHILQIKELNNSPYGEYMSSIIPTQDSNFVLCGVSSRLSKKNNRPHFMMYKVDRNFNIIWCRDLGENKPYQSVQGKDENLIELRKNVYIMSGMEDSLVGYPKGKIVIYNAELDSVLYVNLPLFDYVNTLHMIDNSTFQFLSSKFSEISNTEKMRIGKWNNGLISFKKEIMLDESKFRTIDGIYHRGMYKTPDGGFIIPGWGFGPQLSNSALGFVVKTDSCGFTEGDTCTVRMKVNNLVYNTLTTSVLEQASQYCGVRWNIGDSVYWSPAAIHTFKKKGLYEVKLLGWAADRVDSTSLWVSIDSIWIAPPKDTTVKDTNKNTIQSYRHFSHTLSLYPNPAKEFIEIDWKIEMSYNTSIDIHDIAGVLVKSIELPHHSTNSRIPIQELASGIYQVIWRDKGEVREMKRMVKE